MSGGECAGIVVYIGPTPIECDSNVERADDGPIERGRDSYKRNIRVSDTQLVSPWSLARRIKRLFHERKIECRTFDPRNITLKPNRHLTLIKFTVTLS